jgi:hypothetical protein
MKREFEEEEADVCVSEIICGSVGGFRYKWETLHFRRKLLR